MTKQGTLIAKWCALGLTLAPLAVRAETNASVGIRVNAATPGAPIKPVWAYFGYDEANYTTTTDGVELIRALSAANSTPVRTRTHFLFNTGDGMAKLKWGSTNLYTEDAAGNPIYDYSKIDAIMDATVGAGAFPLVELGFMPQALSTRPTPYENSSTYAVDGGCFYPPRSYEAWGSLVSTWASHVKERYPDAETNWEWELWNEPDVPYWKGTTEEYLRLYDYTEAALHAVLPGASLGGPAIVNPAGTFLPQFLQHCATGTNAVTGKTGTRLDMVSFHAKGGVIFINDHPQMNLGNQMRLHRSGFEAVAQSAFVNTPIVITEADPDGCAACPATQIPQNAYRNSPAYGAYEVAMMKRSLELAQQTGVNLKGILTWAFTFPGSAFFAGYRALASNGIHLPVMNAFKLLGQLKGPRLEVESSGALPMDSLLSDGVREAPDIDALATISDNRVQILVWNYHDDLVDVPATPITVTVALPSSVGSSALLTHRRVDANHGNAYAVWQSQGSPILPSSTQLEALRVAMEPALLETDRVLPVEAGNIRVSFELPRFGLSLLTLTLPGDGGQQLRNPADAVGSGCNCSLSRGEHRPSSAWLLVLLAAFLRLQKRKNG